MWLQKSLPFRNAHSIAYQKGYHCRWALQGAIASAVSRKGHCSYDLVHHVHRIRDNRGTLVADSSLVGGAGGDRMEGSCGGLLRGGVVGWRDPEDPTWAGVLGVAVSVLLLGLRGRVHQVLHFHHDAHGGVGRTEGLVHAKGEAAHRNARDTSEHTPPREHMLLRSSRNLQDCNSHRPIDVDARSFHSDLVYCNEAVYPHHEYNAWFGSELSAHDIGFHCLHDHSDCSDCLDGTWAGRSLHAYLQGRETNLEA